MIVSIPDWLHYDVDPLAHGYHSGSVGSEVEVEKDERPRRPIGFRMPEKDPDPPDPDWMLL